MKEDLSFHILPSFFLYIPHGSDERSNEAYQVKNLKILFISHMVQMKVYCCYQLLLQAIFFISHMVQMKVVEGYVITSRKANFISHMVQMKELVPDMFENVGRFLYIPHGSDESGLLRFSKSV